jgi:predicted dehydrogenase
MNRNTSRRTFLKNSLITTAGLYAAPVFARKLSANDKLNIGVIGTAHRAASNIKGVLGENIVAICDVDETYLDAAAVKFPDAKKYFDFRKLLEQKDIDAVVVSTADHTHAFATSAALKSGRHVYCEKPLAHDVHEIRTIRELAGKNPKLATQMGTQMHATANYRRAVELVQTGAIGNVTEVHVWCQKSQTAQPPTDHNPPPKTLHWDLWLGPVADQPYHKIYHPHDWRAFWDFGTGTLGDMACHYVDLVYWALKLHAPLTVAAEGPAVDPHITPAWMIAHWEFPARGELPPVKMHWYDGVKYSVPTRERNLPDWKAGILFIGDKGNLFVDYTKHILLPEEKFKNFAAPAPFLPDSIGHHEEWIQACKTGQPTSCNFERSGELAEAVLLGNVAYRTGKKLEWNAAKLKVTNTRDADAFLQRAYRKGWKI